MGRLFSSSSRAAGSSLDWLTLSQFRRPLDFGTNIRIRSIGSIYAVRTKLFYWNKWNKFSIRINIRICSSDHWNKCFIGTNIRICLIGTVHTIGTNGTNCPIRTNIRIFPIRLNLTVGIKKYCTRTNYFIRTKYVC